MKNLGIIEELKDISTLTVIKDLIKESNPLTLVYENETSGYVKFDNGLIIQWGQREITPSTTIFMQDISYPISFTKYSLPFISRSYGYSSPSQRMFCASSLTTSTFRIIIESTVQTVLNQKDTYFWFAIGV
ncbi:hypothetical protein [Fusobacterium sp.]|uniref:gp53-like domain-containing protein n=1 Tax=Fusobacterium sp. TaxID=68766 RepID=UPI0028FF5308|nr:hypothetical protein [Fusobacterium sp.]MDU1912265.1 hypothetical protein [Fusobacterium sp.]